MAPATLQAPPSPAAGNPNPKGPRSQGPGRPTLPAEDIDYEIVDGIPVEAPPMSWYANKVADRLWEELFLFLRAHPTGKPTKETQFILRDRPRLERRPDVAYVSFDRWPADRPIPRTGEAPVVPDLAVEVISPTNNAAQLHRKVADYLMTDVRQVWVIDPDTATVLVLTPNAPMEFLQRDDALRTALLPGFEIVVGSLFPPGEPAEPAVPPDDD